MSGWFYIRKGIFLKAARKPVSAGMFWRLLPGTIAILAFGYAGDTGVLEAWIGLIFGMSGWFYIRKGIFMSEAGGVAGERSQAFKEAFKRGDVAAAVRYMHMREYLVQVHE